MRMRRAPALAGALLLILVLAGLLAPDPRLAVTDESGATRLIAPALTLRYVHSVERTIVEEDLGADVRGVRVLETRFSSFGAGLPSQPQWGGRFVPATAGVMAVADMSVVLPEVRIRVGRVSEQALVDRGRAVRLDTLVAPGQAVTIRSVTLPRVLWWIGR